jgi:uncharacterized protein
MHLRCARAVIAGMATIVLDASAEARLPIIDMHLHARAANYMGANPPPMCAPFAVMPRWDTRKSGDSGLEFAIEPCAAPIAAVRTDEAQRRETLAIMRRRNIIGMVSGEPSMLAAWKAEAPERIIAGLDLRLGDSNSQAHVGVRTPEEIRKLLDVGAFAVLGEVMTQYEGYAADDPVLEPYWALAESLDIPVGIHSGPGGPGEPYFGSPAYRARNGSPLRIEDVLVRHPRLRLYLMHAGYPFIDDLRAVLFAHPQLYVDIASIVYTEPRPAFYAFLKSIVDAGYGDRVMFGSDQMIWPGIIEPSIKVIEDATFLNESQKRDIFYNNAVRFLRLSDAEVAAHRKLGEDAR